MSLSAPVRRVGEGRRGAAWSPAPRESRALTRVAVVRYDAFGDLAGALSFSAALLDDAGNGLVLSSINGRSETRTYAKGITAGHSDAPLSPEEQEAIAEASAAPAGAGRPPSPVSSSPLSSSPLSSSPVA